MNSIFSPADFTDLPEFGVGHFTNLKAMTGCTCFVARGRCSDGVACGVDVRGGGPATRETDLLRPENMVQKVNAVMIGGGSAFGLAAANGAMQVLADRGIGFSVGPFRVPIIPAACIFDLFIGEPVWPTIEDGARACGQALDMEGGELESGIVGAATGALVGQMGLPEQVSKSGFGWAGAKLGDLVVICCVAVNAVGNIMGADGQWIRGPKDADGKIMDPLAAAFAAQSSRFIKLDVDQAHEQDASSIECEQGHTKNTTLGVVLTNAPLNKAQATKVSQQAHDGYARAIKPVHTTGDGDAIFTMASGTMTPSEQISGSLVDLVGIMAADIMEDAIRQAMPPAPVADDF